MACEQTKAVAPAAVDEQLPTLLKKKGSSIGQMFQGITKNAAGAARTLSDGASDAMSAVGNGATSAATAMGNGVQQMGTGVTEVVKSGAGEGGLLESKGPSSTSRVESQSEKTWYDNLLSLNPWACCCQQPATDSNLLGTMVKHAISSVDTAALGVKVDVGALHLDPTTGRIAVDGLTVFNPEGWHSEYLFHADRVVIDIDMQKLVCSFGKELHADELVFDGVDVIYEKGLCSSNLNDLLKKFESEGDGQAKPDVTEKNFESEQASGKETAQDLKVVLHQITAQNIGAKMATALTRGHGIRVEVGNIKYEDFDTEMGAGRGLMDIIRILMSTLIKSVLATVVGKENVKAMTGAADEAKDKI